MKLNEGNNQGVYDFLLSLISDLEKRFNNKEVSGVSLSNSNTLVKLTYIDEDGKKKSKSLMISMLDHISKYEISTRNQILLNVNIQIEPFGVDVDRSDVLTITSLLNERVIKTKSKVDDLIKKRPYIEYKGWQEYRYGFGIELNLQIKLKPSLLSKLSGGNIIKKFHE